MRPRWIAADISRLQRDGRERVYDPVAGRFVTEPLSTDASSLLLNQLRELNACRDRLYDEAAFFQAKAVELGLGRYETMALGGSLGPDNHIELGPRPRRRRAVVCQNAARDAWVAKQRERKEPPTWEQIFDEVTRSAAKKGWDPPGSAKALEQAYRRYRSRQRHPRG